MSISLQLPKSVTFLPSSFLGGGNTKKCEDRECARAGIATCTAIMLSSPQHTFFLVLFHPSRHSENPILGQGQWDECSETRMQTKQEERINWKCCWVVWCIRKMGADACAHRCGTAQQVWGGFKTEAREVLSLYSLWTTEETWACF